MSVLRRTKEPAHPPPRNTQQKKAVRKDVGADGKVESAR